ncbi:DUF4013 domain-containing protein [Methanoculleus chikugoensis]|uniref:DUF4013 domain-containing protein n=1 Tax=Methanoculleus chikugoensis TaxID=118126 RepID=UPI0006D24E30|nr:DUF4013 domain-containing protein [Methanoculleus chikugoensis]
MGVVRLISESFDYAKDAIWGRWVRWLLLLVSTIIFPFMYGYTVRVMSGMKPAPPELEGWIGLFVDGIKLIVITIVYAIPLMILTVLPFLMYFIPVSATVTPPAGSGPEPLISPEMAIFVALAILVIFILAAIIIGILSTFAAVRFARTGKMREAFRVGTLVRHVGRVGWIRSFIALLVMGIVITIAQFVLALIPLVGPILVFLLMPAFIIFSARYVALLYESAPPAQA